MSSKRLVTSVVSITQGEAILVASYEAVCLGTSEPLSSQTRRRALGFGRALEGCFGSSSEDVVV